MALAWEDCQCAVNDKVMLGKRPAEVRRSKRLLGVQQLVPVLQ